MDIGSSSPSARTISGVRPTKTGTAQAAEKGPSASLAPSAAGSTYREYASPAAFGRRLASGTFLSRLQEEVLLKEMKKEPNSTGSKQAGISPCFHAPGILTRWKSSSWPKRRRSSDSLKTRQ